MTLEVGKVYRHTNTDRKIIMLGRLDTLGKKGCLIGEDVAYGILLPIINEDPTSWKEESDNPPEYRWEM